MLAQYTRVILLNDRHMLEGASRGMAGYVIEIYGDGNYEVEFSGPDGTTLAQIVVSEDEIEASPENHQQPN